MAAAALTLAACVQVPKQARLLSTDTPHTAVSALDPRELRVVSWNLHKATDEDLPADLAHDAAAYDLLLLQEAVPTRRVLDALEQAGHAWQMVGAFSVNGLDRGVLVTAKAAPLDTQVRRSFEPAFPLPKSALIVRYRLKGRSDELAVANLHGINFTLGTFWFRKQLEDMTEELKDHKGPIIFGGDFNTWSPRRDRVLHEVMDELGLVAVTPSPDQRRRAFGQHLDHLFVRGFTVLEASAPEVESSDHNPIVVRLAAPRR